MGGFSPAGAEKGPLRGVLGRRVEMLLALDHETVICRLDTHICLM